MYVCMMCVRACARARVCVSFSVQWDTHGSVRTATRPPAKRLRNKGSIPGRVKRLFSLQSSDGHMTYPAGVGRSTFAGGYGSLGAKLNTQSILCHRLITHGPIPPLRHTSMVWGTVTNLFLSTIPWEYSTYIAGLLHSTPFCGNVLTTRHEQKSTLYEWPLFHYPFWEVVYDWSDEIGRHVVPNNGTPDVTDEQ